MADDCEKEFWKAFKSVLPEKTKVHKFKKEKPDNKIETTNGELKGKEFLPPTSTMLFVDWHPGKPWPHQCSYVKRGDDGEFINIIDQWPPAEIEELEELEDSKAEKDAKEEPEEEPEEDPKKVKLTK